MTDPPHILIIGAGARGNAYAHAITRSTSASIAAVAEPLDHKRISLGRKYIWGNNPNGEPTKGQSFTDWRDFILYERDRRIEEAQGKNVGPGIDGVFVCTLDATHADIVVALTSLKLHIMCEKPLATSLADCTRMYKSLKPQETVFGIGHVLHYSPHNTLLKKLLVQDEAVGEVISMEHTEPVGWWHFAHSYVR